jgi:TldD protein
VLAAALEAAAAHGCYLIGRLQDRLDWSASAQHGRLERVGSSHVRGLAVQVFGPGGAVGFASTDLLEPAEARRLVEQAARLAESAARAGAISTEAHSRLERQSLGAVGAAACPLAETPQDSCRAALVEAHRELTAEAAGFALTSAFAIADDEWRIVRSDGTDVAFRMPRAMARHSLTARGAQGAATAVGTVTGADYEVLLGAERGARLQLRARRALQRARAVADAPTVRPGSYRIVLDHSMAKGLAHEAFGHAAESDIAAGSILATDGRLRLGEEVGPASVSIVDGPVEGDYAWQPISANGLTRETVEIIRAGVLHSGLSDPFSAEAAGSPLTGACRAGSFRSRPMPRMSNIRLVVEGALPLERDAEELTPAEAGELLREAGLLEPGEPALLLAGHRGGQVSPQLGDFVFTCAAINDLAEGGAPRKPAIFSGRSLSALRSIVGALGPLQLDAPGQCVKGGQGVPTSGGSHAFVVLAPHAEVSVGG